MSAYDPEKKRAYAAANADSIAEYQAQYRAAHREKQREYNRAYHAANRDRRRAYDASRRADRPKKQRTPRPLPTSEQLQARKLRKTLSAKAAKYGMTAEQLTSWYTDAWIAQEGRCPGCGECFVGSSTVFTAVGVAGPLAGQAVVDHNHDTDRVRGLLCSACNTLAGRIETDVCRAVRLVEYLIRHEDH